MRTRTLIACAALLGAALLPHGCGTPAKIDLIRERDLAATLALSRDEIEEERRVISMGTRDTLTVKDDDGATILLMKAVKDEATGEMVATDVLDAAVITARFRNVAERGGRIDLRFEVIVPGAMQDSKWQLRFYPDMYLLEDSVRLEPVIITGYDYRRGQLRGYEQYNRFLRTIISDTTRFIDLRNLEVFLQRNIPQIYRFKTDSTFVSDSLFHSFYGLTEQDAVRHYTNTHALRRNERRKSSRQKMYAKYVKVPIDSSGIRLDTVLRETSGDFVYHYTQTIRTRPHLRKVDIVLSGDIWEGDRKLYTMSRSEPLTFYISSISALVDGSERYLSRVIERRAAANTACYVEFPSGKADIDPALGHNVTELSRIRGNVVELLENRTYDIDSIVITASASPEGGLKANTLLSERRAASVASYLERFIRHYRDSVQRVLDAEARDSYALLVGEDGSETASRAAPAKADLPDIRFLSHSNGENWDMLSFLVGSDTLLGPDQVRSFMRHMETRDPDARERALQQEPYYPYMRQALYPRLRTVRFDFHLHRKGMVKDTIHTTELDSAYMRGVHALRERDYETALTLLRPYRDYNTAIAFIALDYNASALAILQDLERTPQVSYMLAILYARRGDDQQAVQCYLDACRADRSYVFRGNLDPEIYVLIQRYSLNKEDDDPWSAL